MEEQVAPNMSPQQFTIGQVGEHAVIAAVRAAAPSARNGDDAAVLSMTTPNARYVATTDMLVENRHFNLDWSTPEEVGAKAAVQNFADVEAMGARATSLLLGISAPLNTPLDTIAGIARGLQSQCSQCAAEIVGGDVVRGESLVLSITAMGELGGPVKPLTLSGARVGDTVIASGPIGWSAAGLALLQHYGSRAAVPDQFQPLVDQHVSPEFHYGRGPVVRATGAGSLTDNSDGLVSDLRDIALASGVSIDIDSDTVAPNDLMLRAAELTDNDPWDWVFNGGEDHTLLGTTSGDAPTFFRAIGAVGKTSAEAVTVDGREPWLRGGWVSF
ncbi:thiamine-phosphate kinase [Corynebacterium sputi]|uniref:thiamine-phosphate kinase n=1 Tax=Corynebacterium sputi TaxID=489915 RepID=UPI0004087D20